MIHVVAKKWILEDCVEEFIETARELVEMTRKEEGCIQYELHQDVKDPTILTFIEKWESPEALKAHMQTEHFTRLVPVLATFSNKEGEFNQYTQVL